MKFLKWFGIIIGSIIILISLFLGFIYIYSSSGMSAEFDIPSYKLEVTDDSVSVAHGEHIYTIRACADCHGTNLAGATIMDAVPVGTISGSNLTTGKGGIGSTITPENFDLAMRHGVRTDGSALIFMPSHEYSNLTDEDLAALYAYIKSVEPVDNEVPELVIGPVFRMLYTFGSLDLVSAELIDHDAKPVKSIKAEPTKEYGEYLAFGCVGCHGAGYSGGEMSAQSPNTPPPTNITLDKKTGLGNWSLDDFKTALRKGKRPDGSILNAFMPWRNFAAVTDIEIEAMWEFLKTVEPKPYGNR